MVFESHHYDLENNLLILKVNFVLSFPSTNLIFKDHDPSIVNFVKFLFFIESPPQIAGLVLSKLESAQ